MPDPIRLAIIGTGLIVTGRHWPALQSLPREFRVVALANRTAAKAEALADQIRAATRRRPAVYSDYRELLAQERPDAVSLALPTYLNPEVIEAALAAGCHVIAEKPIAANLADAAAMLPWAQTYGRTLMIAENYRYVASFRRAAALIADGAIGTPQIARWSLYSHIAATNPYYQTAWRQQPAHPGGYLSDGGVHQMAVLRMLLGEVAAVTAQVAALRADLPPADTLHATLRFASGALGSYDVTYAVPGPAAPLQVVGTEGALLVTRDLVEQWVQGKIVGAWTESSAQDGMVAMYQDFAHAVRTGQAPRSTAAEGYADLQLIVAMLRAAETGREVAVG